MKKFTAIAVDDSATDEDAIRELTQAVASLQEQIARGEQIIPRAEVVETRCQCVIL